MDEMIVFQTGCDIRVDILPQVDLDMIGFSIDRLAIFHLLMVFFLVNILSFTLMPVKSFSILT